MAKAKISKADQGKSRHGLIAGPVDPGLEKEHPNLWAYLYQDKYDDGTIRRTATLLVFLDEGFVKACLNDRENNRSFFKASGSLNGVLAELEEALETGTADWRAKKL